LNEGDLVLLNSTNIISQKNAKRVSKKLIAKLIGLFKIVQKISAITYRLKLMEILRIHPVFHVSLLKPYYPSEFRDEVRKELPKIATKNPEEHEVEAILDKRTYYCRLQYLVKWKGLLLYDATWKPLTNLENYKDLVKEFEKTSKTVLNGKSVREPS
ncbi:545_t:CDS:1, partial [Racocetra persica]